ncbi:MAG: hypothetical protein WC458_03885 [Patescibacteria group bacterium]|jgi:hypothetical protein
MKKKLSFIFLLFILSVSLFLPVAGANFSLAAPVSDTLEGLDISANEVSAFEPQTSGSYGTDFLATKAGQIVGLILSFVGVLFLILMIYAGIMWMTASGNEQQISKAKSLLINAIIGIIVVFAAYAAVSFLGTELSK